MKFLSEPKPFIKYAMKKVATYLKILLPLAALVALYFIAKPFLNQLTHSVSTNNKQTNSTSYHPNYDLSQVKTLQGSLLSFGAKHCSACRKMEKVVEEIGAIYSDELQIETVSVMEKEGLKKGKTFGLVAIPFQVIISKDGQLVYYHTGYISTAELIKKIKQHLKISQSK
jgi:thiol-disulfide isomerase/thioredoxin